MNVKWFNTQQGNILKRNNSTEYIWIMIFSVLLTLFSWAKSVYLRRAEQVTKAKQPDGITPFSSVPATAASIATHRKHSVVLATPTHYRSKQTSLTWHARFKVNQESGLATAQTKH